MDLLQQMKVSIDTMTLGEKFLGSMLVTFLGIGIVFIGLAVLYISITIMNKVVNTPKSNKELQPTPTATEKVEEEVGIMDDMELVAVITAAVAASLHTSTHNIVVRNITRISDATPSWAKMGRVDQVSNKL